MLDLTTVTAPTLAPIPGLTLQGAAIHLGDDGLAVTRRLVSGPPPTQDYRVLALQKAVAPPRVFDVKDVRQDISKSDTGTTFLLTDDGLFVIRRPGVEMLPRSRELEWSN